MKRSVILIVFSCITMLVRAQPAANSSADSVSIPEFDTTIVLHDVYTVKFKNADDEMEYQKTISRIRVVLPYIKMAKRLYVDIKGKKETEKKRDYRHYRHDMEKELRGKFEKELRDLSINQGKVFVKLLNRETGNNCYGLIKEIKGGFAAWTWQLVAKHYTYDLKEKYNPRKEWILEMAINYLGPEYDPN